MRGPSGCHRAVSGYTRGGGAVHARAAVPGRDGRMVGGQVEQQPFQVVGGTLEPVQRGPGVSPQVAEPLGPQVGLQAGRRGQQHVGDGGQGTAVGPGPLGQLPLVGPVGKEPVPVQGADAHVGHELRLGCEDDGNGRAAALQVLGQGPHVPIGVQHGRDENVASF